MKSHQANLLWCWRHWQDSNFTMDIPRSTCGPTQKRKKEAQLAWLAILFIQTWHETSMPNPTVQDKASAWVFPWPVCCRRCADPGAFAQARASEDSYGMPSVGSKVKRTTRFCTSCLVAVEVEAGWTILPFLCNMSLKKRYVDQAIFILFSSEWERSGCLREMRHANIIPCWSFQAHARFFCPWLHIPSR